MNHGVLPQVWLTPSHALVGANGVPCGNRLIAGEAGVVAHYPGLVEVCFGMRWFFHRVPRPDERHLA